MPVFAKAIRPKLFTRDHFRKAMEAAAKEVADEIEKDFQATVKTWNHQPEFEKLVSAGPGSIDILIGTDDEIYRYVDEGTRDHFVAPVNAPALRFHSIYAAKTTPGVIGSKRGGASGDVVFSGGHWVSGIDARGFDKAIKKKWRKRFKRRMERAMAAAKRATGHNI